MQLFALQLNVRVSPGSARCPELQMCNLLTRECLRLAAAFGYSTSAMAQFATHTGRAVVQYGTSMTYSWVIRRLSATHPKLVVYVVKPIPVQ